MSSLDDKTLQQLFDGELDEDEAEAVRARIEDDSGDAQRLASLAQMRRLIRAEAEAAADAADFEGLWPAVAAEISLPKPDADADADASLWARMKAWLGASMGAHPLRWAAAGVCAVAAAVVLGVLLSSSVTPDEAPTKSTGPVVETGDDVDIEKMEFKGRHPDIFQIKDGKRTTTVIWVYPDDEDDEDAKDNGDDSPSADPI